MGMGSNSPTLPASAVAAAPRQHTQTHHRRRGKEEKDTKKKDPKIFIKNFSLKLEVPHTNKVQKL